MAKMYMQSMHGIVLMFLGISEGTTFSSISNLLNPATEATVEIYAVSTAVFLFGLMFSSLFFGNVLALLMSWDQQNAQFRNRMDIIAAEMRHYELPEELQVSSISPIVCVVWPTKGEAVGFVVAPRSSEL